ATQVGIAVAEVHGQAVGLLFQDDVDHAGHRIGAIDGRGAAGQYFDAIHHAQRNAGDVGGADTAVHRQGEVGQAAAVDQHQGVVRAQAAQVDLLRAGGEVGVADRLRALGRAVVLGHGPHHFRHVGEAAGADLLG